MMFYACCDRRAVGILFPANCVRLVIFFFNDTATTEIYTTHNTLSLHDALPTSSTSAPCSPSAPTAPTTTSVVRSPCARSEEHTSELQSLCVISYAVFCLKK